MYDLSTLIPGDSGWTLHDARGINRWGDIVGYGGIGRAAHAYLAYRTDVDRGAIPEPATGALFLAGLAALAVRRRRARG